MTMTTDRAKELIETVFSFDYVGDTMIKLRRDTSSAEAREALIDDLVENAIKESGSGTEDVATLKQAATERVDQFIVGTSASQSGCGGTKKLA